MGSGESFGDRTVADAIVVILSIHSVGCYRDEIADGNRPENYFSYWAASCRYFRLKRQKSKPTTRNHSLRTDLSLRKQLAFAADAMSLNQRDKMGH